MNDLAGPVALALVGLWVAYLVPHKLRYRQQLLESRTDDRFSEALRVLAVTDRSHRGHLRGRAVRSGRARDAREATSADCGPAAQGRTGLLTPGWGVPVLATGPVTGGTTVDRPHATQDRITADAARRAAQARAARAAAAARRAAASRRRAALVTVLAVVAVAGWGAAGLLPAVTWVAGLVPSVLLVGVLTLGRRAVVAGEAADAAWAQEIERAAARQQAARERRAGIATGAVPVVTGRAVHPSDTSTEMFSRVVLDEDGRAHAPVASATGRTPVVATDAPETRDAAEDGWSPVPVPRPTYTMKPAAPRREPIPLADLEGSTAAAARTSSEQVTGASGVAALAAAAHTGDPRTPLERPATTTGSIDLDAVLAKRRAAGE
ncbi:hypothetical protein [Cellulomonas soli]|uniref:hypothetical protein n=1 Tax=Cellulomonas soli TaxID=931535 RepID=UPI0011BF92E5|nr:hypothetical protein [Cellulomonas soli]NYI59672.1 hypothetical protein [Cellulomonas soli]